MFPTYNVVDSFNDRSCSDRDPCGWKNRKWTHGYYFFGVTCSLNTKLSGVGLSQHITCFLQWLNFCFWLRKQINALRNIAVAHGTDSVLLGIIETVQFRFLELQISAQTCLKMLVTIRTQVHWTTGHPVEICYYFIKIIIYIFSHNTTPTINALFWLSFLDDW